MSVITGLEPEPHTGGVRVQVDGTPFATIAVADVSELGLSEGAALDASQRAALGARADLFAARSVALRMLANRPLPARELVRRLARKGHPKPLAESAVGALAAAGLVDDGEFARHYARTRARGRRLGRARLVADLRRLGVEEHLAERAVREVLEGDGLDEHQLAREAATRRLRSLGSLPPAERARRLRAFLRRRGFGAAEVAQVIREVCRR